MFLINRTTGVNSSVNVVVCDTKDQAEETIKILKKQIKSDYGIAISEILAEFTKDNKDTKEAIEIFVEVMNGLGIVDRKAYAMSYNYLYGAWRLSYFPIAAYGIVEVDHIDDFRESNIEWRLDK